MGALRIIHHYDSMSTTFGGPPRVVQGLCHALAEAGHQVTIVTTGAEGWEPSDLEADFPGGGRLRLRDVTDPAAEIRQALPTTDLVHLHNFWAPTSALVAAALRRAGTPYVVTPHGCLDPWAMQQRGLKKRLHLALAGRRLARQAGAVHLLTEEELDGVRRLGLRGHYFILPNGIAPREWEPLPPPGAFRAAHPELGDSLLVVYMARLSPKKGPDLLLRAFAEVGGDARLVLAGPDYGSEPELRDLVRQQGLADRVFLPGSVAGEERRALLQEAGIFALPSHQEGHPMGVVEAAYLGKPLLITPACHCSDLTPGVAAEVVSDDLPGVTAGLRRLLEDESYRRSLGAQAQRIAREKYTWDSLAAELAGHYRTILQAPGNLPAL